MTGYQMGFVYFIRAAEVGLIKIGWSFSPVCRLSALQQGCPVELELAGAVPGAIPDEHALQGKFAHLRVRGEWFREEPELQEYVRASIEKAARDRHGHRHSAETRHWFRERERAAAEEKRRARAQERLEQWRASRSYGRPS